MLDKDQIIDIIVEKTHHSREDIQKMIQETIDEQEGLINEDGAAHMLAHNLNISLTNEQQTKLQIQDIKPEMTGITLVARVSKIYPVNTFERDDGNQGKVRNIVLIDGTGEVRVALWNNKADELDKKDIGVGDIIQVGSVNSRTGWQDQLELSLNSRSTLDKLDSSTVSDIPEIEKAPVKTIEEIQGVEDKTDISIKAKIIDKREKPSEFTKRDGSDGKVTSIRLLDTTGKIRLTFWDNDVDKVDDLTIGDVLKISDVNVGSSDYGKELTFRSYSTIESIEDETLAAAKDSGPTSTSSGEITKLKDVEDNMRGLNVTGKILSIGQLNSFERDGETNYVSNITISDSSNYQRRVTLWRDQAKKSQELSIGDIISISNASSKYSDYSNEVELSVNDYSTIEVITDDVDESDYEYIPEHLTLSEVEGTRTNVSIKLKLSKKFDVRDIASGSKVMNAAVMDENGTDGRLAAWNDDIAKIDELVEGEDYDFVNVRLKEAGEYPAEVTINAMTKISTTELEIDTTFQSASDFQQNNYEKMDIGHLTPKNNGSQVEVKGMIISIYPPSYYEACQACGRSMKRENPNCEEHGVMKTLHMLISAVIDDGSGKIDIKLFNSVATKFIGKTAEEAKAEAERLSDEKAPVNPYMLKEYIVQGKVVISEYDGNEQQELHVHQITSPDFDEESDKLLGSL